MGGWCKQSRMQDLTMGVVLQDGLLIDNGFMQSCVLGLPPPPPSPSAFCITSMTCNHFLEILHLPLVCVVVCGTWQLVPEGRHFMYDWGRYRIPAPPGVWG